MPPPFNTADDVATYLGFENCADPKYRKFYRESQDWIVRHPPMIDGPAQRKEVWSENVPKFVDEHRGHFHGNMSPESREQDIRIAHEFLMGCAKNLRRKPVRAQKRQNQNQDSAVGGAAQKRETTRDAQQDLTVGLGLAPDIPEPEPAITQTITTNRRPPPAPTVIKSTPAAAARATTNGYSNNVRTTSTNNVPVQKVEPLDSSLIGMRTLILRYGKNQESASAVTVKECANWQTMLNWAATRSGCDSSSIEAIVCSTKDLIGCDLEATDQLAWNGALATTTDFPRLFCSIKMKVQQPPPPPPQPQPNVYLPDTEDWSTPATLHPQDTNKRSHPDEDQYGNDHHKRMRPQVDQTSQAPLVDLHAAAGAAQQTAGFNITNLETLLRQETGGANSSPRNFRSQRIPHQNRWSHYATS